MAIHRPGRGMFDVRVKDFFLDRAAVMRRVDPARRRVLCRAGGLVRRESRESIRQARQKRLAEMTKDERRRYAIASRYAAARGRKKPRRPWMASRAGEPPRSRIGLLKRGIFFSYDDRSDSVVVGPAKINSNTDAPHKLEEGGITRTPEGRRAALAPRPYMGPAYSRVAPKIPAMWKDSIR